jgi:fatty acid amide hydrolase
MVWLWWACRAETVTAATNSVACWVAEAEADAVEVDRRLRETGKAVGPLHGVPFSVKDHFAVRGYPVTMGVAALRQKAKLSSVDCAVVATLRSAGAICFCKTTMTEKGDTWGGGSPAFGDTLNPWNTLRTAGGSSCGEGALVGGGGSPFGVGSDVGGSVRVPSAFNGLCGLKPTAGRSTFSTDSGKTILNKAGDYGVLASAGPLTRSVTDLVDVCDVLWSSTRTRRTNPAVAPVPFNHSLLLSHRPLRIGWYIGEYTYPAPHPAVSRAMQQARDILTRAGHTLVPFQPSSHYGIHMADIRGVMVGLLSLGTAGVSAAAARKRAHSVKPTVGSATVTKMNPVQHHPDYTAMHSMPPLGTQSSAATLLPPSKMQDPHYAVAARDRLRDKFGAAWRHADLDVLVCPAFPFPACRVEEVHKLTWAIQTTQVYNFLDYPAGVVPVTTVTSTDTSQPYDPQTDDHGLGAAALESLIGSEGLPVAVQVVARPWEEELCLRVMGDIERGAKCGLDHASLQPIQRRTTNLGGHPQ